MSVVTGLLSHIHVHVCDIHKSIRPKLLLLICLWTHFVCLSVGGLNVHPRLELTVARRCWPLSNIVQHMSQ